MTCIKTGFHGFVEAYQEYVYGDAFAYDGWSPQSNREIAMKGIVVQPVHCFKIVARSFTPMRDVLHFTIEEYGDWFDNGGSCPDPKVRLNSTMLATKVINHGYGGIPINEAQSALGGSE